MTEHLPHKCLVRDRLSDEKVAVLAVLEEGDRLWVLPDTLGTPPKRRSFGIENRVRRGRKAPPSALEFTLLLHDQFGRCSTSTA